MWNSRVVVKRPLGSWMNNHTILKVDYLSRNRTFSPNSMSEARKMLILANLIVDLAARIKCRVFIAPIPAANR